MRIAIISDAWWPQINGVVTTLSRTAHSYCLRRNLSFTTSYHPRFPEGKNGWLDEELGWVAMAAMDVDPRQCREFTTAYSWLKCTRQFLDNLHRL